MRSTLQFGDLSTVFVVAKQISVMDALIPNIVLGSTRKQKLYRGDR